MLLQIAGISDPNLFEVQSFSSVYVCAYATEQSLKNFSAFEIGLLMTKSKTECPESSALSEPLTTVDRMRASILLPIVWYLVPTTPKAKSVPSLDCGLYYYWCILDDSVDVTLDVDLIALCCTKLYCCISCSICRSTARLIS